MIDIEIPDSNERVLDGTVTNPAYSFASDPDTGIYRFGNNAIGFVTGGVDQWVINSSGSLVPATDNTKDIGNGVTNPRDVNVSRDVNLKSGGYIHWGSLSKITSTVDGNITLSNNAGNDFGMIRLGGSTASFPGIKRSGASVRIRLADDSADTSIIASGAQLNGLTASQLVATDGSKNLISVAAGSFGSQLFYDGSTYRWRNGGSMAFLEDDFMASISTATDGSTSRWNIAANSGQMATIGAFSSHPGCWQFSTLASASSAPTLSQYTNGMVFGADKWRVGWLIQTSANLSSGTERYQIIAGFGDSLSNAASVDGAWITYRDDLNSGNWLGQTSSNSVTSNMTGGTPVAVATNTWYLLEVEVNAAGNQADFYVNSTLIGSCTTNIPTGTARIFGVTLQLVKSIGTTPRTMLVDYMRLVGLFGSARF